MRSRMMHAAALVVALIGSILIGTSSAAGAGDGDEAVSRKEFEQRLKEIQDEYKADIAARDKAIDQLKAELADRPPLQPSWIDQQRADIQQQHLEDMLNQIDNDKGTPLEPRTALSFNPDIAVVSDFLGSWANHNPNDAYNRFDVREVELDIRAAVHPIADAVAIIALARDVENPLFPEAGFVPEGPDTSVELEEVYLFLHDFGIPNLTTKVGRFRVRFGRQNLLHLHDLPTSDEPFVIQSFLGPEGLSDAGASLSFVLPHTGRHYIEAIVEVLSGEGASSESPILNGDVTVNTPAIDVHALWNADLFPDWNLELGGSWLWGNRGSGSDLDLNLLGGDLTLIHTDPSGGFSNQLLQAEFIWGDLDLTDTESNTAWGTYVLAQAQLSKDWYVGSRFDWTENPFEPSEEIWGASAYVSWYLSEFLRFRVEYQHQGGDVMDNDVVYFQVTWVIGAHPPHPYWVMR